MCQARTCLLCGCGCDPLSAQVSVSVCVRHELHPQHQRAREEDEARQRRRLRDVDDGARQRDDPRRQHNVSQPHPPLRPAARAGVASHGVRSSAFQPERRKRKQAQREKSDHHGHSARRVAQPERSDPESGAHAHAVARQVLLDEAAVVDTQDDHHQVDQPRMTAVQQPLAAQRAILRLLVHRRAAAQPRERLLRLGVRCFQRRRRRLRRAGRPASGRRCCIVTKLGAGAR